MIVRLNLIVEGQTEETFVNSVLKEHLAFRSVFASARQVTTCRRRGILYRGGGSSYSMWEKDLHLWMKEDNNPEAYFGTILDLYGLDKFRVPFPSFEVAKREGDPYRRVAVLEEAFAKDINHPRFIPYIQLHEFEALILSDPQHLKSEFIESDQGIQRIIQIVEGVNPELIDDGQDTAPSKRIISEIPEYEGRKPSAGPLVAGRIGLPTFRIKCFHFGKWLAKLESLAQPELQF